MALCGNSNHSDDLVVLTITSNKAAIIGCTACGFVMAVNLEFPNQTVELAPSVCSICPANPDGDLVATHSIPVDSLMCIRKLAADLFDENGRQRDLGIVDQQDRSHCGTIRMTLSRRRSSRRTDNGR